MDLLKEIFTSGALGLLIEGGIFMWPILIMLIVVIAVTIERYRSLKILDQQPAALRNEVIEKLSDGDVSDALTLCENSKGPVAAIMESGLRKYHVLSDLDYEPERIEQQVKEGMEASANNVVAALERHLPILATISSIAPMIGFLGTVAGMITAFANIVAQAGGNIIEMAASGIMTALLTTCFGLIVGIPAYIAFNYFMGVINNFVLEVEASAAKLSEAVSIQLTLNRR